MRPTARYCSTACQQGAWYDANDERLKALARRWKASNADVAQDAQHRRRARMLGAPVEKIDRQAVLDRDGGICWLCEMPVRLDVMAPHPLSPSLDHVVPVSKGGGHVMTNLALAHLRCNIKKRDKVLSKRPAWWIESAPDAVA